MRIAICLALLLCVVSLAAADPVATLGTVGPVAVMPIDGSGSFTALQLTLKIPALGNLEKWVQPGILVRNGNGEPNSTGARVYPALAAQVLVLDKKAITSFGVCYSPRGSWHIAPFVGVDLAAIFGWNTG